MKYSINHGGYCIVNFYSNHIRKGFQIHVLVAQTFIPNPENKPTVNHIDGNKENNAVSNLEWATQKEQMFHSFHILNKNIGEDNSNAKAIEGYDKNTNELIYTFNTLIDAGRYFNPSNPRSGQTSIWRALTGVRHTAYGCIWKYK